MAIRLWITPTVLLLVVSGAVADPRPVDDPVALARAGTAAIETRRFGEALDAFTRAAALRPDDASLCFGAGVAAFMLGKRDVAQTRFECALALNPSYVSAAVWLADLHYRAGRLDEAIAIYETARLRAPADRELQRQLAEWRKERELQSGFHELRAPHFAVLFDPAVDERFARDVLGRLEAAYELVGKKLGVYPSQPVGVVLYTREQFTRITQLADWSAAAYDGRIRVPVGTGMTQGEELDRVLSHEYVHAVVKEVAGSNVPAWLAEGVASVLEPMGSHELEATLAGSAVRPALSKLHRGFIGLSRRDAEIAYASAARAVRRLIEQHGLRSLVLLLEDLGRGVPFAGAFRQRIAMRYEDFARLAAHD